MTVIQPYVRDTRRVVRGSKHVCPAVAREPRLFTFDSNQSKVEGLRRLIHTNNSVQSIVHYLNDKQPSLSGDEQLLFAALEYRPRLHFLRGLWNHRYRLLTALMAYGARAENRTQLLAEMIQNVKVSDLCNPAFVKIIQLLTAR